MSGVGIVICRYCQHRYHDPDNCTAPTCPCGFKRTLEEATCGHNRFRHECSSCLLSNRDEDEPKIEVSAKEGRCDSLHREDVEDLCVCGHVRRSHRPNGKCCVNDYATQRAHCNQFQILKAVEPKELVDHATHYGGDVGHEHVKCMIGSGLWRDGFLYNVTKYLWRLGKKDGAPVLQDLKKARWYLDQRIKIAESEED